MENGGWRIVGSWISVALVEPTKYARHHHRPAVTVEWMTGGGGGSVPELNFLSVRNSMDTNFSGDTAMAR